MVICLLVTAGLSACNAATGETGLTFEEAWIRAVPPGMKMTAGFGKLGNPEAEAIELVAFASPSFGDVSLHRTELMDGMSRMREVPVLSIPAGESVELVPGGYHLMLMMPAEAIGPGQEVIVQVTVGDGRIFSFELPVERR